MVKCPVCKSDNSEETIKILSKTDVLTKYKCNTCNTEFDINKEGELFISKYGNQISFEDFDWSKGEIISFD